jgi:oxygen-independent coproporphyrinogen-3 oxidase
MDRYHNALIAEIKKFGARFDHKLPLDTIYMGGGTPSTYPDHLLLDTFGILKNVFDFDAACEVTIEVNPGTVRKEQIKLWRDMGINRLSIGVQSIKDQVLQKLNRHQSAAQVREVLDFASNDFDNLSVDFILGLPDVSFNEWQELLHAAVQWPIKHMSVYFLMVHEDTPLYFGVKKKTISLPCDDAVVDAYYWTVDFLAQHGFEQYEISNFAKRGYQSKHNSMYWDRKPYKAFGLGACEFDGIVRSQNEKSLKMYMESIEQGKEVTIFSEILTTEQVYLEKIMLGLRRAQGVTLAAMSEGLSSIQVQHIIEKIAWLKQHDFIVEKDQALVLTPKGLAVENDIIVKLSL